MAYLKEFNTVPEPAGQEILIENARIIDGSGGIPVERGYVVVKHGWTYQREMELLRMAGLTPLEVIKSGTVLNAAYFGNSPRLGSISVGKAADLILVDGNPSENLAAMYDISAVMLNGAWVKK